MLHWGEVPAWAAVFLSALFGYLSWRSSRRSKDAELDAKGQADRATKAAEDAVAAQDKLAAATERLADATERQWDAAEENPWRIERDDKGDRLRNVTATTKYHVHLRGGRYG